MDKVLIGGAGPRRASTTIPIRDLAWWSRITTQRSKSGRMASRCAVRMDGGVGELAGQMEGLWLERAR